MFKNVSASDQLLHDNITKESQSKKNKNTSMFSSLEEKQNTWDMNVFVGL